MRRRRPSAAALWRRRLGALGGLVLLVLAVALAASALTASPRRSGSGDRELTAAGHSRRARAGTRTAAGAAGGIQRAAGARAGIATGSVTTTTAPAPRRVPVRVHTSVVTFVDPVRTMTIAGVVQRRSFHAIVRVPEPERGRVPLIIFGHGFAVTPALYAPLLNAWAKAGYAVIAPVFPLENADAPGGPDERDLPNQPGDLSFVISTLMHPRSGAMAALAARLDLHAIAVSGQSDGGDTALASADDPSVRDRRVRAAMILSGAEDPFAPTFAMPPHGPPLLAVQGTADTINPPAQTQAFFDAAPAPKFLLWIDGAGHLPPYSQPGPELAAVERTTLAFLDRYLRGRGRPLARLIGVHSAGPGTQLVADL